MNTFKEILDYLRVEKRIPISKLIKRCDTTPRTFYKWINAPIEDILKNERFSERVEVVFHASPLQLWNKYKDADLPKEDISVHRASLVLKRQALHPECFLRRLYEYLIDNGLTFKSMAKRLNMAYGTLADISSGRVRLTAQKLLMFEALSPVFHGFTPYSHIAAGPDLDAVFQAVCREIPRYKEKSSDLELTLQKLYKRDQVTMVFHLLHLLKENGKLSDSLKDWFKMWSLPD